MNTLVNPAIAKSRQRSTPMGGLGATARERSSAQVVVDASSDLVESTYGASMQSRTGLLDDRVLRIGWPRPGASPHRAAPQPGVVAAADVATRAPGGSTQAEIR
jgi:hypothetical protein